MASKDNKKLPYFCCPDVYPCVPALFLAVQVSSPPPSAVSPDVSETLFSDAPQISAYHPAPFCAASLLVLVGLSVFFPCVHFVAVFASPLFLIDS